MDPYSMLFGAVRDYLDYYDGKNKHLGESLDVLRMLTGDTPPEDPQPNPVARMDSIPVAPRAASKIERCGLNQNEKRLILNLLNSRREIGLKTYGTTLHTNNGRCALTDASEELADAFMYLYQAALETSDLGRRKFIGGICSDIAKLLASVLFNLKQQGMTGKGNS